MIYKITGFPTLYRKHIPAGGKSELAMIVTVHQG